MKVSCKSLVICVILSFAGNSLHMLIIQGTLKKEYEQWRHFPCTLKNLFILISAQLRRGNYNPICCVDIPFFIVKNRKEHAYSDKQLLSSTSSETQDEMNKVSNRM